MVSFGSYPLNSSRACERVFFATFVFFQEVSESGTGDIESVLWWTWNRPKRMDRVSHVKAANKQLLCVSWLVSFKMSHMHSSCKHSNTLFAVWRPVNIVWFGFIADLKWQSTLDDNSADNHHNTRTQIFNYSHILFGREAAFIHRSNSNVTLDINVHFAWKVVKTAQIWRLGESKIP